MPTLTKKALAGQLKELMQTRPLEKITVKELVEACGVNRQTFYYHFQDIYDLLEWIFRTEALDAIANSKSYGTWQQGLLIIFEYVRQNERFCLNSYHSPGREHLEHFLDLVTCQLLTDVMKEIAGERQVLPDDLEFIVRFYCHAFLGMLKDWLRDGLTTEPQVIVADLSRLLEGHFSAAVERFQTKKTIE